MITAPPVKRQSRCSLVVEVLRSIEVQNIFEKVSDQNVDAIEEFQSEVKDLLQNQYFVYWRTETRNIEKHPILRIYSLFSAAEPYLKTKMDSLFNEYIT